MRRQDVQNLGQKCPCLVMWSRVRMAYMEIWWWNRGKFVVPLETMGLAIIVAFWWPCWKIILYLQFWTFAASGSSASYLKFFLMYSVCKTPIVSLIAWRLVKWFISMVIKWITYLLAMVTGISLTTICVMLVSFCLRRRFVTDYFHEIGA